ncbi:MAG TPA: transcriptional regulator NrdR [Bacillota bacterium]|nr:transcriptional regulator NrdR [Bacillota bacterium]
MYCANCEGKSTKVLDSRPIEDGHSIRRRRECDRCGYRFTTFERIEKRPLIVIKKDGTRQAFSREKLVRGLVKACEKRPVALEQMEQIAIDVENEIRGSGLSEVKSEDIGEKVMNSLVEIDDVAYVRFASVYRQFKDINVFLRELKDLIDEKKED